LNSAGLREHFARASYNTEGRPQVSKKHKPRGREAVLPLSVLRIRVEKAIAEGRYQHALELARSLAKQDPSEAGQELLRKATLGRARQLREQGHSRDAVVILNCAAQLGGGPAYLADVAQELAACGEAGRALALAERLEDPALRGRVVARAADAALARGPAGKDLLPEPLHAGFDLVVRAFTLVEAGQDEQAREALQGIGLQSPFLEWKLLLRGLIAYDQKDDLRAVENWQRLAPDRLAARLAAPFRLLIDRDFRAAQPPATQAALQRQADRLQGSGLVPLLRALQASLSNERQLPQAFRQAEALLEALRRETPALVPRLAACFYWAIIHHGNPEDVRRYQRVFGAPADDPKLDRLQALALEQRGMMQEAHELWGQFEKSVAGSRAWPGLQADRARALVWWHMGHNADEVPELDELPDLPPFLRGRFQRPRPLKPSAEECYARSLALAPDQIEPYLAVLRHHLKKEQRGKAEKAARKLLGQFPDHAATLETLGDLRMSAQDYAEGIRCFEQALKGNPLERRLRAKLSAAHTFRARAEAEAGRFDEARAGYQAALAYNEGGETYSVLCKWAACEFKAGDDARARELLEKALAQTGSGLAVAFSMLIETIRLKLPRPLKALYDQEVNRLLAEPPSAAAAAAIAKVVAAHRRAGVTYFGQKTHEKKVLTYLEKAPDQDFTEQQLMDICAALGELDRPRLLRTYARRGQQQFPHSPFFCVAEAQLNLDMDPYRTPVYETQRLLKKARELATALPRDDRQQALLEQIKEMEDDLRGLNPFANVFADSPLDPFGDGDEEYEDDGPF
jgi:tetratricopeptide (TPR) repeat protein